MIEIIILLIIIAAAVSSLRKPRTFAEAEYAAHLRQERAGRDRIVAIAILIFAVVVSVGGYLAGHP